MLCLPTEKSKPPYLADGIGIQQAKLVRGEWGRRLQRIQIDIRDHLPHRERISRDGGRVLVLAIDVEGKPAIVGAGAESGDVVDPLPVGAAVIVDQRLAEVIAVVHRPSRNVRHPRVHRIQMDRIHRSSIPSRQFIGEFGIEGLLAAA